MILFLPKYTIRYTRRQLYVNSTKIQPATPQHCVRMNNRLGRRENDDCRWSGNGLCRKLCDALLVEKQQPRVIVIRVWSSQKCVSNMSERAREWLSSRHMFCVCCDCDTLLPFATIKSKQNYRKNKLFATHKRAQRMKRHYRSDDDVLLERKIYSK